MKLVIDDANVKKYNLSLEEFLYLFLIYRDIDFSEIENNLCKRKFISLLNEYPTITERGIKKLITVNGTIPEKLDYIEIAKKLQSVYPEGKKEGTNCMWRDSTEIIARKLKTLVEKYHCNFTEEEAIKVTEDYVKSFNEDFTYMQVLKYFLLKSITFDNAEREVTSEFMSKLENKIENEN